MKKLIPVLLSVSLLFLATGFTGCEKDSELQLARNVGQDIIDCFINKDGETLYSLLSPNAKNFPNVKEQIQEAFNYIDGEIISYELPVTTGG